VIGTVRKIAVAGALLALATAPSDAYEAATTHAGLTEQAAAHSQLHQRLTEQLGYERGLFQPLIVPPADAGPLFTVLRRFNPTHGYVPDGRGRQSALGWLVAGAVVADSPVDHAANHFFDPLTGKGLSDQTLRGIDKELGLRLDLEATGESLPRSGMSAVAWLTADDNPMGLAGFASQYQKAVRSRTQGERDRHTAGTLLAAGAILHVLQDMGSPSHVRNDLAAHLERIGKGRFDVGSRFERVAALAYGRLGVPAPRSAVARDDWRAYFTADDKAGLADVVSARYFSAGTLPRAISMRGRVDRKRLGEKLAGAVRRPAPVPLAQLDRFAAQRDQATLVDDRGVCLARYRIRKARLVWTTDDRCRLEQLAAILPLVSGYSAGLLDYLFRGKLILLGKEDRVTAVAGGVDFGAGKLELFWDDARGVRTRYAEVEVEGGAANKALARAARPPSDAVRVAALFVGVDGAGNQLVAAGQLPVE
jgi:hypothetical protein